jgi:hypothetical protein
LPQLTKQALNRRAAISPLRIKWLDRRAQRRPRHTRSISARNAPAYLREWSYRFNRRNLPDGLDGYLIRRAVECATITYDQLKAGTMPSGANRIRGLPAEVAQPALA